MRPISECLWLAAKISKGDVSSNGSRDESGLRFLLLSWVHVGVHTCWVVSDDVNLIFEFIEESFAQERAEGFSSAVNEVTWTSVLTSSGTDEDHGSFSSFGLESTNELGTHNFGGVSWLESVEHNGVLDGFVLKAEPNSVFIETSVQSKDGNIEVC